MRFLILKQIYCKVFQIKHAELGVGGTNTAIQAAHTELLLEKSKSYQVILV